MNDETHARATHHSKEKDVCSITSSIVKAIHAANDLCCLCIRASATVYLCVCAADDDAESK